MNGEQSGALQSRKIGESIPPHFRVKTADLCASVYSGGWITVGISE
jgi:hypothetical protein